MAQLFPKPSDAVVLDSIRRCFPDLAAEGVSLLAEGWDSWAYESAGCIFRIPKHDYSVRLQAKERLIMPAIAPLLPVAVPDMEFACADGPNGQPFVGYRRIRGTQLASVADGVAAPAGPALGRFLKALHSLPVSMLDESLLRDPDRKPYGSAAADRIGDLYERVVRRVFPLIGCEARQATRVLFESFLGDAANFDYAPCLVHSDLGAEHVLVDDRTFELTGVIDFGDAELGDPAGDFASIFVGRIGNALGPEGVHHALEAYGHEARGFEGRAGFYRSLWPYHEVLGGLELKDTDILEGGLRQLADLGRGSQPCP